MIAVLLIFLVFAVLQLAVYLYVRNIVQASAAAGARYAANQGVDYGTGGEHANALVRQGSGATIAHDLPCRGSPGRDVTGLPLAVTKYAIGTRIISATKMNSIAALPDSRLTVHLPSARAP